MARLFEQQNPGVKIVTQAIPWGAAHEKLVTSVVGGIPPDISQMGTTWMSEFFAMEALEPLDEYIKNSDVIKKENFFEGSWNTCFMEEKVWGVPWYVDTRILFYRKDLLAQVGFTTPPRTWDELKDVGKKLAKDIDGDGKIDKWGINIPAGGGGVWNELGTFVWQNNADFLSRDNKVSAVLTPEFKEAFKFYTSFFKEKIAPVEGGIDVNLFQAFKTGFYPMFISGPWMIELLDKELPEYKNKWDVAPLWMNPKTKRFTSFVGGCNLVVFKKSKNKELAFKFIEFLSTKENQVYWYKITGDLPSLRTAWQDKYFDDKPKIKSFGKQLEDTKSPPNIPEWEQIANIIGRYVEKVTFGKEDEDKILQQMDLEINKILNEKYKKLPKAKWIFVIVTVILIIATILYFSVGKKEYFGKINYAPYFFIAPAIFILIVFLFLPIIASFILSLTNCDIYSIASWDKISYVGFQNYKQLFNDPLFWKSLLNTFIFVGVGVPMSIAVSLFMAIVLNQKFVKFKAVFRAGYFIPVITTIVAVAIVWKWLYNPEYGLINWLLSLIDIPKQEWLRDPRLALPSLIIMAVWKNFGYNMVIFLAGLQAIPASLYEAASIDGANEFQSFWYITIPSLKPTLLFVTITTTIGYFQFFAEPYVMTQGGPLNSTMSIVLYMYNYGFKFFKLGYASAVSYVLFAIIFIFTMVQFKFKKS
jgi:ABC-type sugar transport system permease subunit/ABC-type glycerol-3-phosphate transport system substrate-binding protein